MCAHSGQRLGTRRSAWHAYPLFVPLELPVPERRVVELPGSANAPVTSAQAERRVVKETMAEQRRSGRRAGLA
jgi:hypothetical protein